MVKTMKIYDYTTRGGKIYEVKIDSERLLYVLGDKESIYFLHIYKKQKGKAEKHDLELAEKRARAAGLI